MIVFAEVFDFMIGSVPNGADPMVEKFFSIFSRGGGCNSINSVRL